MAPKGPTDEDHVQAIRIVLTGLADDGDLFEMISTVSTLHPKHNTFPGEVFLGLAAETLEIGGVTRDSPIRFEGLVSTHLPEYEFRRRDANKMRTALLLAFSLHGGLEPDLFDDVAWWPTDDYWRYALCALVTLVRATAEKRGVPVSEVAGELAQRHAIALM